MEAAEKYYGERIMEVLIDHIEENPANIRKTMDQGKLEQLAESIKKIGIIQPLIVAVGEIQENELTKYRLIAGERRLRAAKIAGLETVPVIVRPMRGGEEFEVEVMLVENLQREDLTPIEEAEAYRILIQDHGYTQQRLAEKLGLSQPQIANRLRLLQLPAEVQRGIASGTISASTGKELVTLAKVPSVERKIIKRCEEAEKEDKQVGPELVHEAKTTAWDATKPLHKKNAGYEMPQFDLKSCEQCNLRVQLPYPWNGEERYPRCLAENCWNRKQKEAEEQARQAALSGEDDGGSGKINLNQLKSSEYEIFNSRCYFDLAQCEGCEHKKAAVYWGDREGEICLNPECYKEKQETAKEETRLREEALDEEYCQLRQMIIDEAGNWDHNAYVFTAVKAIEFCCMEGNGEELLEVLCNACGWNPDELEEFNGWDEREEVKKANRAIVRNLMALTDEQLRQVIMAALLYGTDRGDFFFELVYGSEPLEDPEEAPEEPAEAGAESGEDRDGYTIAADDFQGLEQDQF